MGLALNVVVSPRVWVVVGDCERVGVGVGAEGDQERLGVGLRVAVWLKEGETVPEGLQVVVKEEHVRDPRDQEALLVVDTRMVVEGVQVWLWEGVQLGGVKLGLVLNVEAERDAVWEVLWLKEGEAVSVWLGDMVLERVGTGVKLPVRLWVVVPLKRQVTLALTDGGLRERVWEKVSGWEVDKVPVREELRLVEKVRVAANVADFEAVMLEHDAVEDWVVLWDTVRTAVKDAVIDPEGVPVRVGDNVWVGVWDPGVADDQLPESVGVVELVIDDVAVGPVAVWVGVRLKDPWVIVLAVMVYVLTVQVEE